MINRPPSSRIAPSECFYRHNGNLRTTPVKLSASPKCAKNGHGDATVGRNRCSASVYASPDAFNTAKVRVHEYAHGSGCVSASALLGTGPSWRHTGYAATPVAANGTRRARQRLVGAVPFGKWPIAGLRRAGATAPAVFEGAINGRSALSCSRASVGRNDGRGVRWRSDEGEVLEEWPGKDL